MSTGFGGFKNHVVSLTEAEARIDQGVYYTASMFTLALADEAIVDILLVGPPVNPDLPLNKQTTMHAFPLIKSGADLSFEIFRGTTVSDNGTQAILGNHNGVPPIRPPDSRVYTDPTIISDGTAVIDIGLIPGGEGKTSTGGETAQSKWIIPAGEIYLIRLTNISGQAAPASAEIDFYEPVGGFGQVL